MPTVPRYDNFQAAAAVQPSAQLDAPQLPDIAGRRADQLGQAMQQAGGAASRIALDIQDQVNRSRVDDAMNQAISARTGLQVEALQQRGRNALERPDGKSLPDEYGEKLKQSLQGIGGMLGNDAQRQAFQHMSGQLSTEFQGALGRHMVDQQRVFEDETSRATVSTAVNQAALLWGDASMRQQSLGAITSAIDQRAQRDGWDKVTREAALTEAVSPMHLGIIKGMLLGGQAQAAQQYLSENSASMTLQARATAQDMTKGAASLEKAQAFGDEVMRGGLTQADALTLARERFSGEDEVQAVHEVRQRFAESETAKLQLAKDVGRQSWSILMANGSMSAIPPDLMASLRQNAPEEERQMRDWLEAKARRAKADAKEKAETDFGVYYGLRRMAMDNPQAFADIDLRKSEPYLLPGDLKHLTEVQSQISRGDAKAMESQRVLKTTLGAIKADVAAIGIDLTPKEGTPGAQETAKFLGVLTQALDQATQSKGAPLTGDEAKRIGMSMVREGIEQGSGVFGLLQTKKRGYQIASDPDIKPGTSFVAASFGDIPVATRDALSAEYRSRKGLGTRPLSRSDEAEIERAYTRGVQTGRIK